MSIFFSGKQEAFRHLLFDALVTRNIDRHWEGFIDRYGIFLMTFFSTRGSLMAASSPVFFIFYFIIHYARPLYSGNVLFSVNTFLCNP